MANYLSHSGFLARLILVCWLQWTNYQVKIIWKDSRGILPSSPPLLLTVSLLIDRVSSTLLTWVELTLHTQHRGSNPIWKLSFGGQIVGCCHSSGSEYASMFTFSRGGFRFDESCSCLCNIFLSYTCSLYNLVASSRNYFWQKWNIIYI